MSELLEQVGAEPLAGERTGGVLAVLYLMFNEGYLASAGNGEPSRSGASYWRG